MRATILKIFSLVAIIIVLLGRLYYYWLVPVVVQLIEMVQIEVEDELPGTYFSIPVASIHKHRNI